MLFQKMNSINILSFFPGRNSSCVHGGEQGIWGRWAKSCEGRRALLAPVRITYRSPSHAAVLCVTLGLPPCQPLPRLSPDPVAHVGLQQASQMLCGSVFQLLKCIE